MSKTVIDAEELLLENKLLKSITERLEAERVGADEDRYPFRAVPRPRRSEFQSIGEDVLILEPAVIRRPELIRLGDRIAIDSFFYCSCGLCMGSWVHVGTHCSFIGGKDTTVNVGDFAAIAGGTKLVCATEDFSKGTGIGSLLVPDEFRGAVTKGDINVGAHAMLGTNVVVHPGITIGEGAVAGSGSVVTKDLKPWTIYVGVPAKPVRTRPREKVLACEDAFKRRIGKAL